MADEYLNGSVKDIIEPMISALLIAQPEDPKFFMLHWLKNLYSLDYIIINKEKEELENLRLEVKGYKSQKIDSSKQNTEQPLEELKNKIVDETKENMKEIKETEKELETNKTNKENEVETNKQNQETDNQNTNNQNTNNQNIETENKNNDNKSEKGSKSISLIDNKNETKNNNETKNENTDIKNENKNIKDLINFSEESDN